MKLLLEKWKQYTEAVRDGFTMGSQAGSIPASTGMGIMKKEDDEDDKIEEGGKMGHYRRSPSGPDEEMYDLTKGERPPPHSTGDVTRKDPDANTEASVTPNYEVEVEQLVFDMLMSGMSEQEIMSMIEEYVQDAASYAK